jgi:hypothetical protein
MLNEVKHLAGMQPHHQILRPPAEWLIMAYFATFTPCNGQGGMEEAR